MRKGFLVAVGGILAVTGVAPAQAPYGLPYAPAYGYYGQQTGYPNNYGYPPGYGGYAPQWVYPNNYPYPAPAYGYYAQPTGYTNVPQGQPMSGPSAVAMQPRPVPPPVPVAPVAPNVPTELPVGPAPAELTMALPTVTAPAPAPVPTAPAHPATEAPVLDDHCGAKRVCGPNGRFWASAEYLLWWIKGDPLPPLVTTGPPSATAGTLGTPGTVVLLGGDSLDPGVFSGGRFTAGFWLNDCHTIGVEGNYFFLGSRSNDFSAGSSGAPGSPVLARPFFDVSSGLQNSELDAFPGIASGGKLVISSSQLQGPEANLLWNLCCSCNDSCDACKPAHGYRVDLIGGARYLDLRENLRIDEVTQVLPGGTGTALDGSTISAFDQFGTRDQFYGAQIGARAQVWRNRFFADFTGKVALGVTDQSITINGATSISPPAGPLVLPGDLLTQSSNIGHYSRDQFSVVPEACFNVGYQATDKVRFFVGYTFLYWSGVERPADAIDTRVNSTMVPTASFFGVAPSGPLAPLFSFHNSDFWAQGISFGAELRF